MISLPTIKKLNAVDTALNLMSEAGIDGISITIDNIPDEEVIQIAEDKKVYVHSPTYMLPYLWIKIQQGRNTVSINGTRKEIELIERIKQ